MADSVETAAAVVPPLNLNALKGDGDVEVLEHANGNTGTTVEAEASPAADQHGDHELTAGAEENQDEKEEGGKGKGEGGTEAPLGEGENEEGSPDGEKKEQDDKRSDSVHSTDLPIPKAEDPSEEAAVAENAAGEGEATPKAGPGSVRKMPKPFSLANPSTTALQEEKRKYPLLLQKEEFYQMYSRSYRKDMDRGAPLSPRPNRSYLNTARDHADRSTTAANLGGAETVRTSVPSTSRSFSKRGGETERAATMSNHTARKKKNILEIITARKRADGAETDKFKPADHYYAACKGQLSDVLRCPLSRFTVSEES
uniref:Uncharacterized protein n=1 Tax=Chromera velia CCMP2878 TaxID=1169474 RepID=A0A0G4FC31_9ALVE|eukprot:Cvel_16290.t1-p1 / transcript=Cvel_16290.t1 / gene=Cvel_16290 / organism=Chromera_velia_CCMP2878 / gene_product=hypothetical protein / transcript_product=hypothetical protein / location=Cvel_scaffold1248:21974-23495(+) / protein_length=312 / sequence_SO=supercontig / SO=protein_coding / is_pseudo=false